MATGWAGDKAVNEQIDATLKDGIRRALSLLPQGKSDERAIQILRLEVSVWRSDF